MSEWAIVQEARSRALKAGNAATLTSQEFMEIIHEFNGKCAYCKEKDWQVLEHYIPISKGGGTTKENCVPACYSCNTWKGNRHPDRSEDWEMKSWIQATIYLPPELKKWLKFQARIIEERTMGEIVKEALEAYRLKHGEKPTV